MVAIKVMLRTVEYSFTKKERFKKLLMENRLAKKKTMDSC